MAEINANSADIKACSDTLIALSKEYDDAINALFDSLEQINQVAWTGPSANTYVSMIKKDRAKFLNHGEYLRLYGQVLGNVSTNVERIVKKWEDKAENV